MRPENDCLSNYHAGNDIFSGCSMKTPAVGDASDRELVARFCRARDEAAFAELVDRYSALVIGTARQVIGCEHHAEDVHQAVFMVLAQDAKRIRNRANVAGWLYGVTYRIAVRVAKERPRWTVERDLGTVAERDGLVELIDRVEKEAVVAALHVLPEKYRTALLLKYYRRLTTKQVAKVLNLTESAAAGRLRRGRNELRIRLAKQGIGFIIVAAVFEAMPRDASAEMLAESAVHACLHSDLSAQRSDSSVYQLAHRESTSMFIRGISKQVSIGLVAASVLVVGMTYWPSGNGRALAENDGQAGTTLPVATRNDPSEPAVTASLALQAQRSLSHEQKITKALAQPTECTFIDIPLSEVVQMLGEIHDIQIVLEEEGLAAEGVSLDSPVTLKLRNIKLENALRLILRPRRLSAIITEQVLLVTSQQAADHYTTTTKVYSVDDRSWNVEQLVETIESKVEPSTWETVGGSGSISNIDGAIVVRQAQRVHDGIDHLFEQLKRHRTLFGGEVDADSF